MHFEYIYIYLSLYIYLKKDGSLELYSWRKKKKIKKLSHLEKISGKAIRMRQAPLRAINNVLHLNANVNL